MKCINCGHEAGRKGNHHVKARKFTCTRMVKRLETKRKWYGAREENWVMVESVSLFPYDYDLTDWQSTDETDYRYSDNLYYDYYSKSDYSGRYVDHNKVSPSYDHSHRSDDYVAPSTSSDDSWSSSPSYDSTPSSDSGSSWSSSGSSSYDSGSSSSSYDSGSSSSSDSW